MAKPSIEQARREKLSRMGGEVVPLRRVEDGPGLDRSVPPPDQAPDDAAPGASPPAPIVRPVPVLSADAFVQLPPPTWLIEPMLPESAVAVLTAPYSSGKSTLALELAVHVATGRPWQGHPVKAGAVLYLVQEGRAGLAARFAALCDRLGENPAHVPIGFVVEPVSFLDATAADGLLAGLASAGLDRLALVVVDTWHRTAPSADENDSGQTGQRLGQAERLARETGATLLVLHHPSKSGKSARGSGALEDSADTVLRLERDATEPDLVRLSCEKQRDAERFAPPLTFDFVGGQLVRRGAVPPPVARFDPVAKGIPILEALEFEPLSRSLLLLAVKDRGMTEWAFRGCLSDLVERRLVREPERDPARPGQAVAGGKYEITPGGMAILQGRRAA